MKISVSLYKFNMVIYAWYNIGISIKAMVHLFKSWGSGEQLISFFNIVLYVLRSEAMLLNSLHLQCVSQNKDRSDFHYCSFEPSSVCGESQICQRSDPWSSHFLLCGWRWKWMNDTQYKKPILFKRRLVAPTCTDILQELSSLDNVNVNWSTCKWILRRF